MKTEYFLGLMLLVASVLTGQQAGQALFTFDSGATRQLAAIGGYDPATTIFVDGTLSNDCVGTTYNAMARNCEGDDGEGYNTLQEAGNVAAAGDTVLVREGTYRGSSFVSYSAVLKITNQGTAGNPITFQNYDGEAVVIDGTSGANQTTYGISIGNIAGDVAGGGVVIDGFEITGADRDGIYLQRVNDVVIRNNSIYYNNQTSGTASGYFAGIGGVAGEDILIENNRIYQNGYGIALYETDQLSETPDGSDNVVIRGNLIYGNSLSTNYGNSGGIAIRFGRDVVIERNVLWDNPDGGILGLGPFRWRVIGNASLNHWQDPGNKEGIKISVRGGALNVFAFNLSAFNGARGIDLADGIGDVVVNNTFYANEAWGILAEGLQTQLFNNVAAGNYPSSGEWDRDLARVNKSSRITTVSDYNLFASATGQLPTVTPGAPTQAHSLAGEAGLLDPDMTFAQDDVLQIIHPEEIFPDSNSDGSVTAEEVLTYLAGRFALDTEAPSQAIDAGLSLANVETLSASVIADIIASTTARIAEKEATPSLQGNQAIYVYNQAIDFLENTPEDYVDLSGLSDLAGNSVDVDTVLNMGAVQYGASGQPDAPVDLPTYTLTLSATNGSITKSPSAASYDSGTSVTLTAVPATGYEFTAWSGDASGSTNPKTVTMNSNKSITATFTLSDHTITATAGANGTISPSGAVSVTPGDNQSFTITPDDDYQVATLTVDDGSVSTSTTYTFVNVSSDHSINATFEATTVDPTPDPTHTLDTAVTPGASAGRITKSPNQSTFDSGATVTLTASANSGYSFTSWSGDASGSTNPLTVTMSADKSITANFTAVASSDAGSNNTGGGGGGGSGRPRTSPTPLSPTPLVPSHQSLAPGFAPLTALFAVGHQGAHVTQLQQMLARDGLYSQTPTGLYDQATILAVQAFQRKYGLLTQGSPDSNGYGLAGPQTRAKLNALYASPVAAPPSPEVQVLIAELQRQLLVLLQELYRLLGAR